MADVVLRLPAKQKGCVMEGEMKTAVALVAFLVGLGFCAVASRRGASAPGEDERRLFKVWPIGKVKKTNEVATIEIDAVYEKALLGLDQFSHIHVFYWFDRNDTPQKRAILQVHPRGNKKIPLTGVFATRAPVRPNLIALCTCKILSIEGCTIRVDSIDAFDNSPVIDIKPYIPASELIPEAKVPEWVGWH
jgi:tRNA-Thr(GGU) m(6)t(6)A37 methyltransferase TsaA